MSKKCAICKQTRRLPDHSATAPVNKAIIVGRHRIHRFCLEDSLNEGGF